MDTLAFYVNGYNDNVSYALISRLLGDPRDDELANFVYSYPNDCTVSYAILIHQVFYSPCKQESYYQKYCLNLNNLKLWTKNQLHYYFFCFFQNFLWSHYWSWAFCKEKRWDQIKIKLKVCVSRIIWRFGPRYIYIDKEGYQIESKQKKR